MSITKAIRSALGVCVAVAPFALLGCDDTSKPGGGAATPPAGTPATPPAGAPGTPAPGAPGTPAPTAPGAVK